MFLMVFFQGVSEKRPMFPKRKPGDLAVRRVINRMNLIGGPRPPEHIWQAVYNTVFTSKAGNPESSRPMIRVDALLLCGCNTIAVPQ